jgi:hypothetical protein
VRARRLRRCATPQPGGQKREVHDEIPDDDAQKRKRKDVDAMRAIERGEHETQRERGDQDSPAHPRGPVSAVEHFVDDGISAPERCEQLVRAIPQRTSHVAVGRNVPQTVACETQLAQSLTARMLAIAEWQERAGAIGFLDRFCKKNGTVRAVRHGPRILAHMPAAALRPAMGIQAARSLVPEACTEARGGSCVVVTPRRLAETNGTAGLRARARAARIFASRRFARLRRTSIRYAATPSRTAIKRKILTSSFPSA